MLRIAARRNAGQSFRSVSMDLRSTNLNENPGCLVGQGFGPAAGLPPGVVWDGDAPGETTRTRFFRGAAELPLGASRSGEIAYFRAEFAGFGTPGRSQAAARKGCPTS